MAFRPTPTHTPVIASLCPSLPLPLSLSLSLSLRPIPNLALCCYGHHFFSLVDGTGVKRGGQSPFICLFLLGPALLAHRTRHRGTCRKVRVLLLNCAMCGMDLMTHHSCKVQRPGMVVCMCVCDSRCISLPLPSCFGLLQPSISIFTFEPFPCHVP